MGNRIRTTVLLFSAALPAAAASLAVGNAASYAAVLAPGSIAVAFGAGLAAPGGETTVAIRDSSGLAAAAALSTPFRNRSLSWSRPAPLSGRQQ